ncbi:MAG TPA: hypothetical protein VFF68_01410 [Anaerolineaceae bacterium]|nr:hypothetical protein [Anaerolineaceae bacterium]
MIWFVLDDPNRLDDLLDAWESVGVTGVTIFESTGIQRRRKQGRTIHMRYMLGQTVQSEEVGHYTLMSLVPSKEIIDRCLQATEALIGDLAGPETGVFAAWEVDTVKGYPKQIDSRTGNP